MNQRAVREDGLLTFAKKSQPPGKRRLEVDQTEFGLVSVPRNLDCDLRRNRPGEGTNRSTGAVDDASVYDLGYVSISSVVPAR